MSGLKRASVIGLVLALAAGCTFRVPINEQATLPSPGQKRPLSVSFHVSDVIADLAFNDLNVYQTASPALSKSCCLATFDTNAGPVITRSLTRLMEQSFEKVVRTPTEQRGASESQYHFEFLPGRFEISASCYYNQKYYARAGISLVVRVWDQKSNEVLETTVSGQSWESKPFYSLDLSGCETRTKDVVGPAVDHAISSMLDDLAKTVLASDVLVAR